MKVRSLEKPKSRPPGIRSFKVCQPSQYQHDFRFQWHI
jgi:hypothetical protein